MGSSSFHHLQMTSSEGLTSFQHHCKICFLWFVHEKNVAFTLISFAVLPFELLVQIPVQLLLELKLNLIVQNVVELDFELWCC